MIQGASGVFPNGIRKTYSSTLPSHMELIVNGVALDDGVEVGLRMVFRDASGSALASSGESRTFNEGRFKMHVAGEVPSATASIDLEVGAKGAGTSIWVDKVEGEDDPPTTPQDCEEAAAECSDESCASICGQEWCDACTYEKDWGCNGTVDSEGDCILMPSCYCDIPNSITLTSY